MHSNTLYYTFNAMPQVLAAIAAIIGAFTHFRINNLKEYLIGDGKSVLSRWGEIGYKFPNEQDNEKQKKRMIDAVERKSIPEIKDVIRLLRDIEKNEGYSKKDRPGGLQYLYEDRFCGTESHIKKLKERTIYIIGFSFITIILSIVSLGLIDIIVSSTCIYVKYTVLWINMLFFILSLIFAFCLIRLGFSERTVHETDR